MMFPYRSVGEESACNAGDPSSIPGLGRSPRERNGNPLQYSRLENFMERGAWWATVHGVARVRHDLATKPPPSPWCVCVHLSLLRKEGTVLVGDVDNGRGYAGMGPGAYGELLYLPLNLYLNLKMLWKIKALRKKKRKIQTQSLYIEKSSSLIPLTHNSRQQWPLLRVKVFYLPFFPSSYCLLT